MKYSIFGFIIKYSRFDQIKLLILTLISFPFLYFSLDLPKIIINKAISGGDGERSFYGIGVDQVTFLILSCFLFLLLVLINGGFKMRINTQKGILAERMLRRLRFDLYNRVLKFPLPRFQRLSQGELVSVMIGEVEPLGGFIGDSFVQPLFQGGTMLTILAFMFIQNWILGLASLCLMPLQIFIIPRMQKRVNQLNRERVLRTRKLSEQIGETVSSIREVQVYRVNNYKLAAFSNFLGRMFVIRFEIYKRKFMVKFVNNFINQLTVFFFYLVGGYLVITGAITVGALVAAIAAYKELSSPWKELLDYYQAYNDSKQKFEQIIEQFDVDATLLPVGDTKAKDAERFLGTGVGLTDESGLQLLKNLNFDFAPASGVAITSEGSAKDQLALIMAGLIEPTTGVITLNGKNISAADTGTGGAQISYLGSDPQIFNSTIWENIFFGLMRRPPDLPTLSPEEARLHREAIASGNSPHLHEADWIDYAAAGCPDRTALKRRWLEIMQAIEAEPSFYERALAATIADGEDADLIERLMEARRRVGALARERGLDDLIYRFDENEFNPVASLAENIMFGLSADTRFAPENAGSNPHFVGVIQQCDLLEPFIQIGHEMVERLSELFHEVPAGHPLFERFSFLDPEAVIQLERLLRPTDAAATATPEEVQKALLSLALNLIPERHRIVSVNAELRDRILMARHQFSSTLPEDQASAIEFFAADRYAKKLPIIGNLLFGRIAQDRPGAENIIRELIDSVIAELNLRERLIFLTLNEVTGISGARVPLIVRHQIALARCLMRPPAVMIFNDALSPIKPDSIVRIIENLRVQFPEAIFIWIGAEPPAAPSLTDAYEMFDGRLVRRGAERVTSTSERSEEEGSGDGMNAEVRLLANTRLFSTLLPNDLRRLVLSSEKVSLQRDQILMRRGEIGDSAYVVIHGEGEILGPERPDGTMPVIARFVPGDLVGELALLAFTKRTATLRADTDMVLLRIAKETFLQFVESDAKMAANVLRVVSQRLVDRIALASAAPPSPPAPPPPAPPAPSSPTQPG